MKHAVQSIEGGQDFGLDRARRSPLQRFTINLSARICDKEDANERQIQHSL